jgi:fucokinase
MNNPCLAPPPAMPGRWDYLILTASHAAQASAYEAQLAARREIGLLTRVRETLVVADLDGRRIGSGGSTLECLRLVVNRERRGHSGAAETLAGLRILIVHAGGDSRRLPAYGPAGKIFVPVPGESDSALPYTLFDRLVPSYLDLPAPTDDRGQIVVAAGDALLLFDPAAVRFPGHGMTMLGSPASSQEAAGHGVFCPGPGTTVRLYLQKPSPAEQARLGALDRTGKALLDVGVTNLDAAAAAALLDAFDVAPGPAGDLEWSGAMRERLLARGVDLYREICCAIGAEATLGHYVRTVRGAGSKWSDEDLAHLFPALHAIPFHVEAVPGCRFLHFGSTRQLAESGIAMLTRAHGAVPESTCLSLNNQVGGNGRIEGSECWVEGCRVTAPVTLGGRNVLIGADAGLPLSLPAGAALDVVEGRGVWYVRCYGVGDSFKDATYCGRPLTEWLSAVDATESDVWPADAAERTLWNARLFPEMAEPADFHRWRWMYEPNTATAAQKDAWRSAVRQSAAGIALLADQDAFHRRRAALRAHEVRQSLESLFSLESGFSARDLEFALHHTTDREGLATAVLALARAQAGEPLQAARILHTLGTATGNAALCAEAVALAHAPGPVFRGRVLAGGATALPAYAAEQGSDVLTAQPDGVTLEISRPGDAHTYYLPPLPVGLEASAGPPDFTALLAGYLNRDRAAMAAFRLEHYRAHCLTAALLRRDTAAMARYLRA